MSLQVAETIRDQIGQKAMYMLGAKNVCGGENFLQFRTMKTAKGMGNHIKVELSPADTYTVTFTRIHGMNFKVTAEVENVYADQLNAIIEKNTGLCTSL